MRAARRGGRSGSGVRVGRPRASVRARGLHPRRQVDRGRAAPDEIRRGAAEVLVGLVRARLCLFRAEEDRRFDQGARHVAAARSEERRSAQDPRPQPHDHRPVRRRAGRVRAGDPLQAGLRREPLQSRQALLHPGQLGAGAHGVRGCPANRSRRTSRPSMVSASRWKRSATMPARSRSTRRRSG